MEWQMKLKLQPFLMVKSGKKTVELRLFDEKRSKLNVGDRVAFTCMQTGETVLCAVKNLRTFPNFSLLYQAYDKCAMGYDENEQAGPEDMEKYYSKEDIEKYGVVAIEIALEK